MTVFDLTSDLMLGVKEITFSDGQPHFERVQVSPWDTWSGDATVVTRLSNGHDLYRLMCFADFLQRNGYYTANLDITYLTGARMDRSINQGTLTATVVSRVIECGPIPWMRVRVLDPHSDVCLAGFDNGVAVDASALVGKHLNRWGGLSTTPAVLVAPDAGATKKVEKYANAWQLPMVQGFKKRDTNTGALTGFGLAEPIPERHVAVIVDDICDGGGTFAGLAAEIHKDHPMTPVHLVVTHGIFSKGWRLDGIDAISTTDSFRECPLPASMVPKEIEVHSAAELMRCA
jgi:ribose-phosphate pyrophosphokinase